LKKVVGVRIATIDESKDTNVMSAVFNHDRSWLVQKEARLPSFSFA
jgi:hypothetical protein